MSILFLDRIQSGLPTTIIEGKDVSEVLLINPDPNLPPFFLANKAVLRTASKEIDVYDGNGNLDHTIDISETDLSGVHASIDAVDARVDDTNDELEKNVAALNLAVKANTDLITLSDAKADDAKELAGNALAKSNQNATDISDVVEDVDDLDALVTGFDGRITDNADAAKAAHDRANSAHNLATSAQTEAALNTTNLAALDVTQTNQAKNIKELQARTDKQTHDIKTVKRKARSNQLSIDTLEAQMDRQITKNERQDAQIEDLQGFTETNQENIQTLAEDTDSKFKLTGEKFDSIDATFEALGTSIDENNAALETKIGEMDADRETIHASLEATQVDVGIIQDELAIEGLGGLFRQGSDLEAASITSNGSGFIDELYIPPSPEPSDVDGKPQPIGGTYQYHVVNENGSYTKLLSFDKDGLDMTNRPVINVASGQNTDTNAANIGDVKRLIGDAPDNGLVPIDNKWDMESYPVVNAGSIGFNDQISSSGDGASYARFTTGSLELGASGQIYFEVDGVTVGDVNRTRANFSGSGSVLGKNTSEEFRSPYELINWETLQAYPDNGLVPTNDVWNMTGYPLSNVPSVGFKTDHNGARIGFEDFRTNILADTIRFVTQNDSGEYGNISSTGLSLNDLEIKGVRESTTATSAATVGQVNAVHTKVDGLTIPEDLSAEVQANTDEIANVKTTAEAADTLSKANAERLDALVIPTDVSEQVSKNTTDIATVKSTADSALSKASTNETNIGNLSTTVGQHDTAISTNASDISSVETIANAADTLSKANASRLDGLTIPEDLSDEVAANTSEIANVKATADSALSKASTNETSISSLSTTVGQHDTAISNNASTISSVETIANAADTLSKANAERLDNLPTPNLDNYVENGDDVNFGTAAVNIIKVTKGDDPSKFSDIFVDGNTNTQVAFVGDTHFSIRSKTDNHKGAEAFQIDNSANFIAKQKIKTPVITNPTTGTTNSNTANAGFIDFTQDNEVKLGAKNSVLFAIDGNISAGVYTDHVNFNTDYVTGVKMREEASRQPYDAVNWETLQAFSPNLEGLAKLGTAVNFADVTIDSNGTLQSPTTLKVRIDGNETISFAKSAIYPKNNIVMGNKQITGLAKGSAGDHAVSKEQLDTVSHKISDARATTGWGEFTFNGHTLAEYYTGIGDTNADKKANFLEACAKAVDTRNGNSTTWQAEKIISSSSPSWDEGSEIFPRYGTWVFKRRGNTARNELTWYNEHQTKRLYGSISTTGVFGGWVQAANQFSNAEFADVKADNLTLSSDESLIKGNSTGTLVIQNVDSIRRNHTNDSNSVKLGVGNNIYKSDIHHFRNNADEELLKIQNDSVSVKDKKITEVGDGTAITDAVNMRLARIGLQSNTVNVGGLAQLSESGQTLEYWMNNTERSQAHTFYNRIRKARPTSTLGGASHNNWICHYAFDKDSAIWNFLPSNITPASGHMQILHEADLKARWVIWIADKYLLSKSLTFNIGTGASGQPDTAFGVFEGGESGGTGGGGVDYENYITRSQDGSTTFYETSSGQQNAWVVATNNNQGTLTYTFDYSREGQEVVAAIENKTKRTIIAKLKVKQSDKLVTEVPPYSVFTARYVPEIEHYVYNIGTWYPTEQRVLHLDEINPTLSSDYKQMTKNIIAAMPNHTTLIGYHNPDIDGASKYKFVTTGSSGTGKETSKCAVVIHKHTANHAVGLSTTEGLTGGRVYSRVLDGTTGVWNTNSTVASRSVVEEIPLDGTPEDQIFFTEQGILETYIVDEETGEVALRPIEGYNVPQQGLEIEELKNDRDANAPITKYFKNESVVTVPYTQDHPVAEVFVLDTTKTINGASLSLLDDNTHKYSGVYNTVGSLSLSANKWTNYSYHNAFKHSLESYYVVYDFDSLSWVIVDAQTPHTDINEDINNSEKVSLNHRGQLPESYGDYTINLSIENLDSLEFIKAEANTRIDTDAKLVITDFGQSKPSGKVVIS